MQPEGTRLSVTCWDGREYDFIRLRDGEGRGEGSPGSPAAPPPGLACTGALTRPFLRRYGECNHAVAVPVAVAAGPEA